VLSFARMGGEPFQSVRTLAANEQVTVFRLRGKLNGQKECYAWLDEVRRDVQAGHKCIVLNCSELERVDSTGLGIVASIHASTSNAGGLLCLTGLSRAIHVLFETTWLLKVIQAADDEAAAIRVCAGGA
jgi:anti-anti-sigma factor